MRTYLKRTTALIASLALSTTSIIPIQAQAVTPTLNAPENTWLTVSERVYGLSRVWERMGTFSPFITALPDDFDLDALYTHYLPKVIDATDMVDYYEILTRFVNHIGDGKSQVLLPQAYRLAYAFPWMVQYVGGNLVVLAVDPDFSEIAVGSVLDTINGVPALEFLETQFGHLVNTQAPVVRQNTLALEFLTLSPRQLALEVGVTTHTGEGQIHSIAFLPVDEAVIGAVAPLEGQLSQLFWGTPEGATPLAQGGFAQYMGQGIHHIGIRTFANPNELPPAVIDYIAGVADSAQGFVLDIRGNGGGTSDLSILSQFAPASELQQIEAAYVRMFDAAPAMIAQHLVHAERMGNQLPEGLDEMLIDGFSVADGFDMLNHRFVRDLTQDRAEPGLDIWDSALLMEQSLQLFDIPVVILIDHLSASASESFVISAQGVNHFTIMGTNTPGMAGDLLTFDLPGGGLFRLNVSMHVTATGQTVNNVGLAPDVFVPRNVADLLAGVDTQLQAALAHLLAW